MAQVLFFDVCEFARSKGLSAGLLERAVAFNCETLPAPYGNDSMNRPTRWKHAFSCRHDSLVCSSQNG